MEKKICSFCGIEKTEDNYWSIIPNICKNCFAQEYRNSKDFDVFKKYDIPYIYDLWYSPCLSSGKSELTRYLEVLSTSPKYRGLTWKNSVLGCCSSETLEINFYDKIVTNLKSEAEQLNKNLIKTRNNNDYNNYIATLKSLKETLDLINKYDWKLHYSEYEVPCTKANLEEGFCQGIKKQISVWEQNHENNIRNHKVWDVIEFSIKSTKECENNIANALKNI